MNIGQRGFSLLEVLVAFVILALALGVLMRVFSGGINNVGVAERYAYATILAESRLAALGVESPLEEGETSGTEASGYRWRTRVSAYQSSGAALDGTTAPVILFQVEVTVGWDHADHQERQVRLTTLRAAARS
jgi:general secretion pathway protein I